MPIMLFFYLGFEHSIVNMFLFPSSLMLGGKFAFGDCLIWNDPLTVVGHLVIGAALVRLNVLHAGTHRVRRRGQRRAARWPERQSARRSPRRS